MAEVGLFSVAEGSWWASALYSLMRLDASYPNSTAVTPQEVALLLCLAGVLLVGVIPPTKLALLVLTGSRKQRRGFKRCLAVCLLELVVVVAYLSVLETGGGAYVLDATVPESGVPVVEREPIPSLFREEYRGQSVVVRDPKAELGLWKPNVLAKAFASSSAAMQVGNVEQGDAIYTRFNLGDFFATLEDDAKAEAFKKEFGSVPYLAEENN
eukprot:Hpha_TRINITY_DN35214_c0_g1::TRINITY_DN35214_c0_g1_i1::g.145176::m.145176